MALTRLTPIGVPGSPDQYGRVADVVCTQITTGHLTLNTLSHSFTEEIIYTNHTPVRLGLHVVQHTVVIDAVTIHSSQRLRFHTNEHIATIIGVGSGCKLRIGVYNGL